VDIEIAKGEIVSIVGDNFVVRKHIPKSQQKQFRPYIVTENDKSKKHP
jgi:hypothetical protein